jgi:hypothetical protein
VEGSILGEKLGLSLIKLGEFVVDGIFEGTLLGIIDGATNLKSEPPHTQQASPALFPLLK